MPCVGIGVKGFPRSRLPLGEAHSLSHVRWPPLVLPEDCADPQPPSSCGDSCKPGRGQCMSMQFRTSLMLSSYLCHKCSTRTPAMAYRRPPAMKAQGLPYFNTFSIRGICELYSSAVLSVIWPPLTNHPAKREIFHRYSTWPPMGRSQQNAKFIMMLYIPSGMRTGATFSKIGSSMSLPNVLFVMGWMYTLACNRCSACCHRNMAVCQSSIVHGS